MVRSLEEEKLNLQSALERLNSQIQLLVNQPKPVDGDASCSSGICTSQPNDGRLEILKKRIAYHCSDDGVSVDSIQYFSFDRLIYIDLNRLNSNQTFHPITFISAPYNFFVHLQWQKSNITFNIGV